MKIGKSRYKKQMFAAGRPMKDTERLTISSVHSMRYHTRSHAMLCGALLLTVRRRFSYSDA